MRKVFDDILPRYQSGSYRGNINRKECANIYVKFICDDIGGYLKIVSFKDNRITIKFNEKIIDMKLETLLKGNGLSRLIYGENVIKPPLYHMHDMVNNLIILDLVVKNHELYYKYKCKTCGNVDFIRRKYLERRNKQGCNVCACKKVIEGINDIPTTAPWMIPYFQGGYDEAKKYTKKSNKKIYPICPDCKRIYTKSINIYCLNNNHGFGCICKDGISYPNKLMFYYLKTMKYNFETEFSGWEELKGKRFDFIIHDKKTIIEMDGGLGHGRRSFADKTSQKNSIKIDKDKEMIANDHGYNVIRIDAIKSDISYIHKQILGCKFFNKKQLDAIDFTKADSFARRNFCKTICTFYKEHPEYTLIAIANNFNISSCTVLEYLKLGSKIGWCDYKKRIKNTGLNRNKKIEVILNENTYVYDSCAEAAKKSVREIGVDLNLKCIWKCANGIIHTYKGCQIRYCT